MENIIRSMIEKAIYYKEDLSLYDESRELLQFAAQLIEQIGNIIGKSRQQVSQIYYKAVARGY